MNTQDAVAVIVDVVGSRDLPDRVASQRQLVAAMDATNRMIPALQPLEPTVGDESQAAYRDVYTAIMATLILRLTLPESLDCRFGLGAGKLYPVGQSSFGTQQDGSAWWSARQAIDQAKSRETGRNPGLRTWYLTDEPADHPDPVPINAYLLCRDQLVSSMNKRTRRVMLGLLKDETQASMASAEGVSPAAISQGLRREGANAVLASALLLGWEMRK